MKSARVRRSHHGTRLAEVAGDMEKQGAPGAPVEHRRHLRIAGPGALTVSLDPPSPAVGVLDISAGGFAILAARPIPPGELFRVEFQLASRPNVQLRAQCVYCSRTSANGSGPFRAGFAFVTATGEDARALARLIDDVTGALPAE